MIYSKETIQHLTKLIQTDDANERAWLQTNKFPELILLYYALDGNENAFHELKNKKHTELTAFALVVLQDDKQAYNWLAQNKYFTWAATGRVTLKDMNAEAWLMRHKLPHYVELAKAIRKNEENQQADDIFGLLKKLVGALKKKKQPRS
jgi:hypothetical protein